MPYFPDNIILLSKRLYNISQTIYFYSYSGKYICCNRDRQTPEYPDFTELLSDQQSDLMLNGIPYGSRLCSIDGVPVYYLVAPKDSIELLTPYITNLMDLIQNQSGSLSASYENQLRMLLTNQLANYSNLNYEMESIIHTLGYSPNVFRVAILCQLSSELLSNREKENTIHSLDLLFAELMEICTNYSTDDIFGSLTSNQFLVFKTVPSGSYISNYSYIISFLQDLQNHLAEHITGPAHFFVGSAYESFQSSNMSYQEAEFLMTNHSSLIPSDAQILFINDFLPEYFSHTYLDRQNEIIFRDYNYICDKQPHIRDTLSALAQKDYVLTSAGEFMNLHRNTMNQRYRKIVASMKTDPVHSITDRFSSHIHYFSNVCSVTWNLGLHIQGNSLQHHAFTQLANVLHKKSHGSMQLNIHHISEMGDNQHLLMAIENHELDIGLCGSAALYSLSQNLASLIELPFLFDTAQQAQILLNQIVLPLLQQNIQNTSVICPALWVIGSRHITSRNEPIRIPDDLKGKSIRTMNAGSLYQFFQQIGAHPMVIAYNELYQALRSGFVDCQENPYANILGINLQDVQQYINSMQYYYNTSALFISKTSWNKLSPRQQSYLMEAIQETSQWLIQEQKLYNLHCRNILEHDKGMTVIDLTEQEQNLWLPEAQKLHLTHPMQAQLRTILQAKESLIHAADSIETDI